MKHMCRIIYNKINKDMKKAWEMIVLALTFSTSSKLTGHHLLFTNEMLFPVFGGSFQSGHLKTLLHILNL